MSIPLAVLEGIIGASGVAPPIEAPLPAGVRHRRLPVSTLLTGMMLTLADDRPAHLARAHQALTTLPADDQARPGVAEEWRTGPHQLTCRQVERTFDLVADALSKDEPDGAPSDALARARGRCSAASARPTGAWSSSRPIITCWSPPGPARRPPT